MKDDFIFIEELPKASEILTLKLNRFGVAASAIDESEFLLLLNKARPILPDDKLLLNWQYAPWYTIDFVTQGGKYNLQLYLGGLGIMTLPNEKRGALMFALAKRV